MFFLFILSLIRRSQVLELIVALSFLCKIFYKTHDILHQTSCVEIPQQNDTFEQKYQHILNVAHALLFQEKISFFCLMPLYMLSFLSNDYHPSYLFSNPVIIYFFILLLIFFCLKVFGCSKPCSTPMDRNLKLIITFGQPLNNVIVSR